jgi:isoleucyl-tRNA synthetase
VIAPEKVIKQYGAEILRLWVSASDYRDDIRISDKILKQLTDAYRRIRNTGRFLLGNLSDFDPSSDAVPYAQMLPIDRYALHVLQDLVARSRRAYDAFEFHTIYHSLFNYCTLDLSAFYLDILKDRLYTTPAKDIRRRSAQTAIHRIAHTLARLMAPIMVFTAEEIWKYLPATSRQEESIHMAQLPREDEGFRDDALAEQWRVIRTVRGEVTKALETARAEKVIGHSLDAAVTVGLEDHLFGQVKPYDDELRSIFIVSKAELVKGDIGRANQSADVEGIWVKVMPASGEKCSRCWVYDPSVGQHQDHPAICERCHSAIQAIAKV